MEKNVSEAIKYRRSVRRFDKDLEIDDNIVKKCIENAVQYDAVRRVQATDIIDQISLLDFEPLLFLFFHAFLLCMNTATTS